MPLERDSNGAIEHRQRLVEIRTRPELARLGGDERRLSIEDQEHRAQSGVEAAPLALVVLAAAACTRVENEVAMPGTVTFDCRQGLDADCEAMAYANCPNGYENAARITADARMQTRVIRCK